MALNVVAAEKKSRRLRDRGVNFNEAKPLRRNPSGRGKKLFSRPAFFERKTIREPHEKNLELDINKSQFPHLQLAAQDKVLNLQDTALKIEVHERQEKTSIFREMLP